MAKILFISENEEKQKQIMGILQKNSHDAICASAEKDIISNLSNSTPDIVILDGESSIDLKIINKKIKSISDSILTILLIKDENEDPELLKIADAFLQEPISKNILLSTISANLRTKNSLEKLSDSNQELARSLYQLNVLYSTSSQFAGTLDKNKLIDIMLEGMDKSLNFGLSCALTFKENSPILIINSLYQISDRLLEALKLRTILNYKTIFEKKEIPFEIRIENLKVEKHVKHLMKEYDFSVLRYDNLFAPIVLSDNFFGFIEIYRENEFSTEDATCFQTLAQQVSLPLKSASLYDEIKQTNQKLERLERLKSEFISIVSHELRTPLTAIKNSLDIMISGKTGVLSEAADKFLNMAKRNVTRLAGIINDLLDLSKIEAGKMDFKFAKTTIEPVIEFVKTSLDEMAKEKGISLVTRIEDEGREIYADAHRLEQVLTNLVSNAIKFTNDGGKIDIYTQVVDAKKIEYFESFEPEIKKLKGDYVLVRVKDNGIGIAQENLVHIFDKFAQIENSLSRKVGGSGLGLPIARQLLEAHNGAIWCNSKIDKGSSFYFAIPVANEENKFLLDLKQSIQKAKINNSSVALMKIKADKKVIDAILQEKNLISANMLNNSINISLDEQNELTLVIPDGDKFSADFLKKKIESYIKERGNLFPNCAILFSYAVYPHDAINEEELIRKVQDSFIHIRNY